MKKYLHLPLVALFATLSFQASAYDLAKAKEAMPFLNSDYAFETLRVQKNIMGGNVVGEIRVETSYNADGLITSVISTTNGQKTLELIDYEYGDKTRTHKSNTYMNGQLLSSQFFSDTFADDFYRNMLVSDITSNQMGVESKEYIEWTYDENGRIIGLKRFANGQLQVEEKDYVWTPTSCEYTAVTYAPMASTDKVKKIFNDSNYVQNVSETHEIDMNGIKSDTKNECTYDADGNLTSLKSYSNGQLLMEWKDFVWGNKKSSHTELMYMNGNIISEAQVEQFYK